MYKILKIKLIKKIGLKSDTTCGLKYGITIEFSLNREWFNNVIENHQKENVTFPSTALRVICMANTEKTK